MIWRWRRQVRPKWWWKRSQGRDQEFLQTQPPQNIWTRSNCRIIFARQNVSLDKWNWPEMGRGRSTLLSQLWWRGKCSRESVQNHCVGCPGKNSNVTIPLMVLPKDSRKIWIRWRRMAFDTQSSLLFVQAPHNSTTHTLGKRPWD